MLCHAIAFSWLSKHHDAYSSFPSWKQIKLLVVVIWSSMDRRVPHSSCRQKFIFKIKDSLCAIVTNWNVTPRNMNHCHFRWVQANMHTKAFFCFLCLWQPWFLKFWYAAFLVFFFFFSLSFFWGYFLDFRFSFTPMSGVQIMQHPVEGEQ